MKKLGHVQTLEKEVEETKERAEVRFLPSYHDNQRVLPSDDNGNM